jgi:hypothetical protein
MRRLLIHCVIVVVCLAGNGWADAASAQAVAPDPFEAHSLTMMVCWNTGGDRDSCLHPQIGIGETSFVIGDGALPEHDDKEFECEQNLRLAQQGKLNYTEEDAYRCRLSFMMVYGTPAVTVGATAGPSKCRDRTLQHGSYRMCGTLLERRADGIKVEIERTSRIGGNLTVYRARMDIAFTPYPACSTIYRKCGFSQFNKCTVTVLAAFTYNPLHPNKMDPFVRQTHSQCQVS